MSKKESYGLKPKKGFLKQDACHCTLIAKGGYELCPDCLGTGKKERDLSLYEKGIKAGHRGFEGFSTDSYDNDATWGLAGQGSARDIYLSLGIDL